MTRRTTTVTRSGPTSRQSGPRTVYVCVSVEAGVTDQDSINSILGHKTRPEDHLLYPVHQMTGVDRVIVFAERHGLFTDPFGPASDPLDLVIAVVADPSEDGELVSHARAMARNHRADISISELPVTLD